MERRTGDVLVAPLDKDDVVSALLDDVVDAVPVTTDVLDQDFFARDLGTEDADEEAVVSGAAAVDVEAIAPVDGRRFESRSAADDSGGVGNEVRDDRSSRRPRHRHRRRSLLRILKIFGWQFLLMALISR